MTQIKKWLRSITKAYRQGVKAGEKSGRAHARKK